MQSIQSDSSFSDQYCLDGNNSLISENAADHKFDEFVSLMQDIPANEEFPEESNAVQEEVPDTYIYAEELASLIEEIEVEKWHQVSKKQKMKA